MNGQGECISSAIVINNLEGWGFNRDSRSDSDYNLAKRQFMKDGIRPPDEYDKINRVTTKFFGL